ncbi:MAG: BtpA/SgcQ family protein, partial [Prolixibacteraceae bacterium]|nr:BtpA/SgcQ family protein [Prolixibacteraceae bacterium]
MIDLKKPGKSIIGMVHVAALPGTPMHTLSMNEIVDKAVNEAEIYLKAGFDGLIIENMHDVPYLKQQVGPEIIAAMTAVALAVRNLGQQPMGIQILAAANLEALAVAHTAGFDFIRAEGFVYGHMADEGYIESCAGELLRYRKFLGAESIAIYTDVKKKHSAHAITSDVTLAETVKTANYFLSDGIVVTGTSTGMAAMPDDVSVARESTMLPVLVGSGITESNLADYWPL